MFAYISLKLNSMKKILLLSSLFALAFVGCKKSSSSDNNSCTLSASSIVGSYKITSVIISTQGQNIEIFNNDAFYDPCERDDIYTVNANGTYAISEGATSCSPSGAETGNWTLNGSSFTYGTETATISEFTCSSFKLTSSTMTGESYTITMTKQ